MKAYINVAGDIRIINKTTDDYSTVNSIKSYKRKRIPVEQTFTFSANKLKNSKSIKILRGDINSMSSFISYGTQKYHVCFCRDQLLKVFKDKIPHVIYFK